MHFSLDLQPVIAYPINVMTSQQTYRTPEIRMRNLLHYFGWHGGTIHQLAEATGCTVQTLLYDAPSESYVASDYSKGACANETCSAPYRILLSKESRVQGNHDYWVGVACAVIAQKCDVCGETYTDITYIHRECKLYRAQVNHASDCPHWVGETCTCVTAKDCR